MSILITGNKGYIGSGLEGDGIDIKDGVDIITYQAQKKYDFVVHTAAKTSVTESMEKPEEYIRTNVMGTLNMLRQHPEATFIYLSTAGIYGEGIYHMTSSPICPESVYAATKYLGEKLVMLLAKSWAILRLTNVVGEGERGEPNVYQIFKDADILPVYGDGLQTRDFVDIKFVRSVIKGCMDGRFRRRIFNVGSGVSKSILQVAREFDKPVKFFPARRGEIRNFGLKLNAVDNITES